MALGQINPTKYTTPKDYLAKYSGIMPDLDEQVRDCIRDGVSVPVPIPEPPSERPPGPLMVKIESKEQKERKAMEFSLNLGGVSKRFPARRGENLDIYLAKGGDSSAAVMEGKKRKIHSIPVPSHCQEMLVFFLKPPTRSWKGYQVVPMDFSPAVAPARSVLLVNFSKRTLLVRPDDGGDPAAANAPAMELKPGTRILYKVPENLSTIRLLYFNPATPDKILCSVNCEAIPGQRALAFTYGLGSAENGIDVACRSLQFPLQPLNPESLDGVRDLAADDPVATE